METVKISVIIPTFNRAHTLKETLNSVAAQSYRNWECIVVDDGSTDATEEIIASYLKDQRFQFIKRPENMQKGACTCRNIGISNATGDYFQFLDSDDLLSSNKFEIQLNALRKINASKIATCKWGGIKPMWNKPRLYNGLPVYFSTNQPLKILNKFATNSAYFPPHVYLVPKELIENWNTDLKINQDGEYFTRMLLKSEGVIFCSETYVLYRTGSGNRISNRGNTDEGILNSIYSWKVIDRYIESQTGIKNHIYIKQAKANLYKKLLQNNSSLIKKNEDFFSTRTPNFQFQFFSIWSKLKSKLFIRQNEISN